MQRLLSIIDLESLWDLRRLLRMQDCLRAISVADHRAMALEYPLNLCETINHEERSSGYWLWRRCWCWCWDLDVIQQSKALANANHNLLGIETVIVFEAS